MEKDVITTKRMVIDIQENGIIRNDKGYIIARLNDDIGFEGGHIYNQENQKVIIEHQQSIINLELECKNQLTKNKR